MLTLNKTHQSLLESYSRPIVHLRRQVSDHRFGLVFGAGLSKHWGIPTWGELVRCIAEDPEVQGDALLKMVPPRAGLPYKTEMLFEHFKQRRYAKTPLQEHNTRQLDFRIGADWREIVRKYLYGRTKDGIGKPLGSHPYLKEYLPLIQQSQMTVTYNFDDFIEQSILASRQEKDSRGYETVTNPWTQFRRATAIIYHPNGVIPQQPLETPSDRFVFSEASYAEQLMGIFAGDQAGLLNHFSKHTCLLIGLSLEDETLRNVLVQGARSSPGNFHYYVHYLNAGESLNEDERKAITLANFKVYNLVTLFLDDAAIRALGQLLNVERCPTNQFCDFACEHNIPVQFRFYVTGPMGVGKSTTVNHFRNLVVLDEWLDQRPSDLAKDWEQLTDEEEKSVDDWILNQFRLKNDSLRNEREGIFLLDRGPLDPLSFTSENELRDKATNILKTLCPGRAKWKVEDGKVILLQGDSEELALRMVITQRKDYTADKLEKMETRLANVYGTDGVISFDTRGLMPADVARRVAQIVHLEEYQPTSDLHERLKLLMKEGLERN